MKNTILVFVLSIMSSFFYSQGTVLATVEVGGVIRNYRVYVPEIYDESTAVPVVFNYHGYTSSAFEQEIYANFKPIADTANFLIVFPQGLSANGNTGFNNFGSLEILQPELDFFNAMLNELGESYTIDLSRIYSTGISNGGFMSYDLACYQSDKIAAIASVSGSMMNFHLNNCNPEHSMPVMQFHGTDDEIVLYEGQGDFVFSEPIEDLLEYWIDFNDCDEVPIQTNLPDINLLDESTVEHYLYENGNYGVSVEFYKIIGGGHTWPGAFPLATLGVTNQDFNACKEIWRFFSQYSLDNVVTVEETKKEQTELIVYPNPTSDFISIESDEQGIFILYDLAGKIILEKEITNPLERIELAKLAPGSYIYKIKTYNTKTNTQGKLIVTP